MVTYLPLHIFSGIVILGERDFSQFNSPTRFCHLLVAKRRITNYPKSADRVRWPDPPNGCTKCGNPLRDDCVLGPDSRSCEGQNNKTGQHPKPRLPLPTNIVSLHSSFAHNSAFIAPLLAISRTTHDWQTSGPPPGALILPYHFEHNLTKPERNLAPGGHFSHHPDPPLSNLTLITTIRILGNFTIILVKKNVWR